MNTNYLPTVSSIDPVSSRLDVPLTSVRKIEADGIQVFYRAAGTRVHRCFSCSTDSHHRRLCSAS